MIEEQGDQPAVRVYRGGGQRGEAEHAARLGIGALLQQEACSVNAPVRAGNVQQGLAARVASVRGDSVIEHGAEGGSIADSRAARIFPWRSPPYCPLTAFC